MKTVLVFIAGCIFSVSVHAQAQENSKKLDSMALKVISFLKNKQPDSVYAMTGKAFREKITAENFNSITTTQILPTNDFEKVTYVNNVQGINKYKVDGTPSLQLLIGLDKENKIETLLVQPYVEDK